MDFKTINLEEEIVKISKDMQYNLKVFTLKEKEINELKEANKKTEVKKENLFKEEVSSIPKNNKEEINQQFEEEIDYYLQELYELNDFKNIKSILPVRENYNYENIMIRLMAESHKNIKNLREVYLSEENKYNKEEILSIKEEIVKEQKIIKLLHKEIKTVFTDEELGTNIKQNNLIFVPMKSGKIRVLDEISRMDMEYYDKFLDLFESIKHGTFKNIGRLFGENLSSMCEVKGMAVRVVFQRLDYDNYAVVTAFIKKTTNNQGYLDSLTNKVLDYKEIKDTLKDNLNNKGFCELNKQYEEELFSMLKTKTKRNIK